MSLPGEAPRQDGDLDGDDAVLHHPELSRGGVGDVEDATLVQGFEGDPVVDSKLYFAVVVQLANADARIERQIVVGRGELVAVERLAASGRLPVECFAVPACQSAAYVAVGSAADRGAGAAAREHRHDEAGEEQPPFHDRPEYHGGGVGESMAWSARWGAKPRAENTCGTALPFGRSQLDTLGRIGELFQMGKKVLHTLEAAETLSFNLRP